MVTEVNLLAHVFWTVIHKLQKQPFYLKAKVCLRIVIEDLKKNW